MFSGDSVIAANICHNSSWTCRSSRCERGNHTGVGFLVAVHTNADLEGDSNRNTSQRGIVFLGELIPVHICHNSTLTCGNSYSGSEMGHYPNI